MENLSNDELLIVSMIQKIAEKSKMQKFQEIIREVFLNESLIVTQEYNEDNDFPFNYIRDIEE